MNSNLSHPLSETTLVVIPALNEEGSIGTVITSLQEMGFRKIRVVDNGSTDRTVEVARTAGADAVDETLRGYGSACWRGLQEIPDGIEWILFCDADGSDDLDSLPEFVQLAADYDLLLSDRSATPEGRLHLTLPQRLGSRLAGTLIGWIWGQHFQDLGPLRLIRRRALEVIDMQDRGFGWTVEMQARAAELGLRCREIATGYHPRQAGESKISRNIKGSLNAGVIILSTLLKLWLKKPTWCLARRRAESPTVIMMLKEPRPGQVKTRLARDLGPEKACEIYKALASGQLERVPASWNLEVCFDPPGSGSQMRQWLGMRPHYHPQDSGSLGDRLRGALLHPRDSTGPVLFIGGDCPGLDEPILEEAARHLRRHDIVLIPAEDGGYVLIGMREPFPELFDGIDWSTDRVLDQTLDQARVGNLSVACMDPLYDVDDLKSWQRSQSTANKGQ